MGVVVDIEQGIREAIEREANAVELLGQGVVYIAQLRRAGEGVAGDYFVIHAAEVFVVTDIRRAAPRAMLNGFVEDTAQEE